MNGFEILYLIFGTFVTTAGAVMIGTYSVSYPWWRDHLGRMMVTYATAEVFMSLILLVTVVGHVSPLWFRAVWFGLQTVVGGTFCFQTATIIRLRRRRQEQERPRT